MIKKRYVKRIYFEEVYCDKCGAPMYRTNGVLDIFPAKYSYACTNPECDGVEGFWENELPGLKYEFEDEKNV